MSSDILHAFATYLPVAKTDDLKSLLCGLPFQTRLFHRGSCISIQEGLTLFSRLEKAYSQLNFLSTKSIFSRRENYESCYRALKIALEQIPDVASVDESSEDYRLASIIGAICGIRSELIIFYQKIHANPLYLLTECSSACDDLDKLEQAIPTIIGKDSISVALKPLITYLLSEVRIITCLLRAQTFISNLHFIDSLLSLKTACNECSAYVNRFKAQFPSHGQVARSVPKLPALPAWLCSFYSTILAKYSLYWFTTLSLSAASTTPLLHITEREDPSLVRRLLDFHRRSNAQFVSLFFDTTGQSYPFLGHGYVVRGMTGGAPTGVDSIPAIFTLPLEKSLPPVDLYSIVMQISGMTQTDDLDNLLYSFDEKLNHTYFIQKLEYRIFLALVYTGMRSRKDRQILEFISSLSNIIRLRTLCTALHAH